MTDSLRVVASRVAALLVGTLSTYLLVHYKLDVPPTLRTGLEELIAALFTGGALALATHFGIAIRVNPDDAASPHAAAVGKAKQNQRKRTRAIEARIDQAGANAPYFPPKGERDR